MEYIYKGRPTHFILKINSAASYGRIYDCLTLLVVGISKPFLKQDTLIGVVDSCIAANNFGEGSIIKLVKQLGRQNAEATASIVF